MAVAMEMVSLGQVVRLLMSGSMCVSNVLNQPHLKQAVPNLKQNLSKSPKKTVASCLCDTSRLLSPGFIP